VPDDDDGPGSLSGGVGDACRICAGSEPFVGLGLHVQLARDDLRRLPGAEERAGEDGARPDTLLPKPDAERASLLPSSRRQGPKLVRLSGGCFRMADDEKLHDGQNIRHRLQGRRLLGLVRARQNGGWMNLVAALGALVALVLSGSEPRATAGRAPEFNATISRIDSATRARMIGSSWHRGCPVPVRNLRELAVSRWGFDREVHRGWLIVQRDQARRLRAVMHRLFEARYPIRRMRVIDAYGGNDRRSMAANNTSAFNCRYVAGTTRWSQHAYGRAVDVNPVQNPYVSGSYVSPPAGERYVDRSLRRRGMIYAGNAVVRAFAAVGWEWGGRWTGAKDYQHFSANGH
jgi:D-alanyl-D-alanine carboxypeptidase